MDWKTFLTNEAVSNYLIFGAGLLVGLFLHFGKKFFRRPSIIELVKQREVDLITLSEDAKSKLQVTFEKNEVDHFYLSVLEVKNITGGTIENIDLRLYLHEASRSPVAYEITIEDPLGAARTPEPEVSVNGGFGLGVPHIRIKLPFLNDTRIEKDRLVLKVYSPEPLVVEKLEGGGKGWMSRYFDRVAYNDKLDRMLKESKGPVDMAFGLLFVSIFRRLR